MRPLALLAAVLALALFVAPVRAQQQPISAFHVSRVAIAAGSGYDWHYGSALNPEPVFKKEFAAGLYGAYVLTPHVSLYAGAVYGVDNRVYRFSPGVHYRTQVGGEFFALGLTYDYYAGNVPQVPFYAHEWAASVGYARAISKNLVIGAQEAYGFDNREWRTSVGLRVPIFLGRDS